MAALVDYAMHRVIRKYFEEGERRLGVVKTYKTAYDVYRRLKESPSKVDLRLPWSWYIHGPVVQWAHISPMAMQVGESEGRSEGEAIYRPVKTGDFDASGIVKETRAVIDEQVSRSVEEFLELNYTQVTDAVYERYAPHQFERTFRRLVRGFAQADLDYDEKDLRLSTLARSEFPYDEFPELTSLFVDWSTFMSMAIARYPKFLWDNPGLVKGFQELYGYAMSLAYNENVGPLVPIWREKYDRLRDVFALDLQGARYAFESVSKLPSTRMSTVFREAVLEEMELPAGVVAK